MATFLAAAICAAIGIVTAPAVVLANDPNLASINSEDPNLRGSSDAGSRAGAPLGRLPGAQLRLVAAPPDSTRPSRAPSTERGVAFEDLPNQSLFAELGLRPGDRLDAFNGFKLDGTSDREDLAKRVESARRVRLELTRSGKSLTLNVIRNR